MNTKRFLLFGGAAITISTGLLVYALNQPHESRHERRMRLRAPLMIDASFNSGVGTLYYDCEGDACFAALTQLAKVIDSDKGHAIELEDGGFLSTPKPSYYDGHLFKNPVLPLQVHYQVVEAHPTIKGRYRYAVHDRDHALVVATAATDPIVLAAKLAPPGPLDSAAWQVLMP